MAKILTADEVKKHDNRKSVWMVIRNDVYDVTSFLQDHPGGEDPLLEAAGQDATIAFEDVGHSSDARAMLKKYKVGTLAPGQGCCKIKPRVWKPSSKYHRECTTDPTRRAKSRPRRRTQPPPPPPPSYSRLTLALLALGLAIIIGVAYKKYNS